MRTADEIRAELAVAELAEQMVTAKAVGEVDPGLKLALRDARRRYRELRSVEPGTATPDAVAIKAEVK